MTDTSPRLSRQRLPRRLRLLLLSTIISCVHAQIEPRTRYDEIVFGFQDLPYDRQNPGTGFVGYAKQNNPPKFPSSLEYAAVPLSDVVKGPNTYNFAVIEDLLRSVAANSRQLVLRFYLDFPGKSSGIPRYLLAQGLSTITYSVNGNCRGCSTTPNYSDARLHNCLLAFVRQLGSAYDGDKRLFTIQVGLIGFWGEWHTWPLSYTSLNFPPVSFQRALLQTFHESFQTTQIQVGINAATLPLFQLRELQPEVQNWRIGFSDDSLLSTNYNSYVGPNLRRSNTTAKYAISAIGGEIFPPLQSCVFAQSSCVQSTSHIQSVLKQWRVSWAINAYLFSSTPATSVKQRANVVAKSMGYRFTVERIFVTFTTNYTTFNVTIRNTGLAPCYFPIKLGVRHSTFDVTLSTRMEQLKPDGVLYYIASGPPTRDNLSMMLFLYMYSKQILDTQSIAFSNPGINSRGELPFVVNPRSGVAFPWLKAKY